MLHWLDSKLFTAKQKVKGAVTGLLQDERGLSGIVVAVLLILVAVLAIVLLWQFLGEWINEMWDRIKGESQLS